MLFLAPCMRISSATDSTPSKVSHSRASRTLRGNSSGAGEIQRASSTSDFSYRSSERCQVRTVLVQFCLPKFIFGVRDGKYARLTQLQEHIRESWHMIMVSFQRFVERFLVEAEPHFAIWFWNYQES